MDTFYEISERYIGRDETVRLMSVRRKQLRDQRGERDSGKEAYAITTTKM
jgi:hypothetical protein